MWWLLTTLIKALSLLYITTETLKNEHKQLNISIWFKANSPTFFWAILLQHLGKCISNVHNALSRNSNISTTSTAICASLIDLSKQSCVVKNISRIFMNNLIVIQYVLKLSNVWNSLNKRRPCYNMLQCNQYYSLHHTQLQPMVNLIINICLFIGKGIF